MPSFFFFCGEAELAGSCRLPHPDLWGAFPSTGQEIAQRRAMEIGRSVIRASAIDSWTFQLPPDSAS